MTRIIDSLVAAGTTLTNSTVETVLAAVALPAFSLQQRKVYRIEGAVLAPATNSTDTLTVRVRIGAVTLTGTIVGTTGAVDVANGDVAMVDLLVSVRSVGAGATSVVVVHGAVSTLGAEGTATYRNSFEIISNMDASLAQRFEVTGQWSVASASNTCRAESFLVTETV